MTNSWVRQAGRGWLPIAVVAALTFQLIRTNLLERYRVTSSSMEPTLHGDPATGDIVLVDRGAWRAQAPAPWDVVVLRNRDDPSADHLVKRVLAVGPKWVRFVGGDAFVGDERQLQVRLVKQPNRCREMRFVRAQFDGHAATFLQADERRWRIESAAIHVTPVASPAELDAVLTDAAQTARLSARPPDPYLPGHLSTSEPVGPGYYDACGQRRRSGGDMPLDFGIDATLRIQPGAVGLQLVYEYAETYFAVALELGEGRRAGRFTMRGGMVANFELARALPTETAIRVEFGYLDGGFFLLLDDEMAFQHAIELPRDARLQLDRARTPLHDLLHIGVAGSGGIVLDRLQIFRDPHYSAQTTEPYPLEQGQIFVVGDNAYSSEDSRQRRGDPFELDDLIGRPVAILGPRGRARWLPRYQETTP